MQHMLEMPHHEHTTYRSIFKLMGKLELHINVCLLNRQRQAQRTSSLGYRNQSHISYISISYPSGFGFTSGQFHIVALQLAVRE